MSTFDITLATPSDLDALCALLSLLFAQEHEFTQDEAAQRRGLARIIGDAGTGQILVARQRGQVRGMVNLLYTVSTALGERVAWLEDMVVHPLCRGEGLGSRLIEAAIDLAHAQGCRRITLLTDADNAAAQAFYESRGFQRSTMVPYRLALP